MGRVNRPSPLLFPGNSVVARAHQDAVRHACDRNEAVCLVADFHGVNGRASAEVNGGRGRGDDSLASGADMRGIEFCADCVGLLARIRFTRVDRAKGLLMKNMGMSEPEAFRWIQKTSMDRRLSMREVADAVINQVDD